TAIPIRKLVGDASAAPTDVFGSQNVAVDVFTNSGGTYVLWSDGSLSDTKVPGPPTQVNYSLPTGASPPINNPTTYAAGKPKGSPHVALKAIPRADATYVMFADGSLKMPPSPFNSTAAVPARIVTGTVNYNGSPGGGVGFTSSQTGDVGVFNVVFDPPFQSPPAVLVS
ncbi:unnamed protein product, partial [Phaeothamnion confervicola]